jgi:outer membrane protein OmpA-like peptidoglycan-associated protein
VSIAGKAAYKGCPEPVKMAVSERKILEKAFASLEFESGKDVIKNVSLPSLNALAVLLRSHEKEWKIRLAGHTDNEGSAESNLLLSEKRAKAVKSYLIKKGVDPSNIITEWYGQSRPVAGNSSAAGRKKNRRVEMTMLMKE